MVIVTIKNWFNHICCLLVFGSCIAYFPFKIPPEMVNQIDPYEYAYLAKELFVRYSMIFIACLGLFLKNPRVLNLKLFSFFLLYSILDSALYGFGSEARRVLLNVFVALIFYKTVAEYFDFSKLRIAGWWMVGIVVLNLIWMAFQGYNIDPLFVRYEPEHVNFVTLGERAVGFLQLKANNGIFGAVSAIFLFIAHPLFVVLAIPMLFLGESSSAVMALAVGLAVIAFIRMGKVLRTIAAGVLIVLATLYVIKFDMPAGQFQERFKVWHTATGVVLKENPLFGVGQGKFAKLQFATFEDKGTKAIGWRWAHNEFIQVFFESGLVGIAILILFLISQIRDFCRFYWDKDLQILFAGFLCIAGVSFFNFPFHVGKFAMFFVFVMALYHGKVCQLRDEYECRS